MTNVEIWREEVASRSESPGSSSTSSDSLEHEHDGATVDIQTYYKVISDYYEEKEGRIMAEERLVEATRQLTLAKKKLANERLRLKMERKRGDDHFRKTILLEAVARSLTEENAELKKEAEKRDTNGGTCCIFSCGKDCPEGTCSSCCECCVFTACRLPCSEPCPVPSVVGDEDEEGDCDGCHGEGERGRGTFDKGHGNDGDDNDEKENMGNEDGDGVEKDKEEHGAIITCSDDTPDREVSNEEIADQSPIDSVDTHSRNGTHPTDATSRRDNRECDSEESDLVLFFLVIGGYDVPSDTWDDDLPPLTPADLAPDITLGLAVADGDGDEDENYLTMCGFLRLVLLLFLLF